MNRQQKKTKRVNQSVPRPTGPGQRPTGLGPLSGNKGGGGGGGGNVPLSRGISQRESSSLSSPLAQKVMVVTKGINPVVNDVADLVRAYPLNVTSPLITGNASSVISAYETWKVRAFRLIYEPTCAATVAGVVAIRYDPDPNDPPPKDFQTFISTGFTDYGPVWQRRELRVPLSAIMNLKSYFVDPTSGSTGRDMARMSVPGQIQVYTSADANPTTIGVLQLQMSIEAKTLSENQAASVLEIVDTTPNTTVSTGQSMWSTAAQVKMSGQSGTFRAGISTDAPNSQPHVEAIKPGVYRVTSTAVGTGLALAATAWGILSGETVEGITFTVDSQLSNAAATLANVVGTIVVKEGFKTIFNGRNLQNVLDISSIWLTSVTTLTKLTMQIAWLGPGI